jgi:hypothetical protein
MAHSSVRGVDLGVHACIHMLRVWCRGTCVKCRQSGHLCDGRGGAWRSGWSGAIAEAHLGQVPCHTCID